MNIISDNTIARNVILSNINANDDQKDKSGADLRIKKIVYVALGTLAALFLLTGILALTAVFLPYMTFAAVATTIFKVVAIVTAVIFGIAALTKAFDYVAPKLPRPLRIVADRIHANLTEMFAVLTMAACYFVDLEKQNPKSVEGNNQIPILLIHGLYHNSSAWIEYRKQLNDAKLGPIFTINLGNPFDSIDVYAQRVRDMVANIQRITGLKDIVLIGHSMGGVVATKFALEFATEETKVTDIITIGSPLKGTSIAKYFGWGKGVREMRKGSDYLTVLNDKILAQAKINFFHIASETDALVPIWSSLPQENENTKHLKISNIGHTALLLTSDVINPIIDYYKNRSV